MTCFGHYRKINLTQREWYNGTVFEVAAAKGYIDTLKTLLSYDAVDSQFLNANLGKMLRRASEKGHLNINGETALHKAAYRGDVEIVSMLLDCGIDVNLCNKNGVTALQAASNRGYLNIIQRILASGDVTFEVSNEIVHLFVRRGA
ncbi:hypothetical protein AC1031_014658 [Aphanomyces cochlioides]|nr:hypothetical protein AC1031_014658 [Aphanomyces cochlioides]